MRLFDNFFEQGGPFDFFSRAGHLLAGITWIGLLYFFNFVQTPAYTKLSDGARSEALRNVTFRALWWFRWAAMLTFAFGLAMIAVAEDQEAFFAGSHGTALLTGILLGVTMFTNVWMFIWPNQRRIIASAEAVAGGGTADPQVPVYAKKAARASRTNVLFSIPMLFFMVFAVHGGWFGNSDKSTIVYWLIVLAIWAWIEANALGYVGGLDSPWNKLALDDHKRTIMLGFGTLAVIYFVGWELLLAP